MNEKKTLELILKFGLQEESKVKKAAREMSTVTDEWKKLQREANTTRDAIQTALSQGKSTRELEDNLQRVENALSQVALQAVAMQRNTQIQASQSLKQLGSDLQQVGQSISIFGGALLAAPIAAAKNFIDKVPFDDVSMRWLSAQQEIEQSYLRIGAVAADSLLPVVEKLAQLAEQTANFVEENPKAIDALIGLGSALVIGGGALQIGGKLAEFGGLAMQYAPGLGGAIKGGLATAGKSVGGFITGTGGAVLGGVGAGLLGYEAIANSNYGKQAGFANLGQFASVAAYGAGKIFDEATAQKWFTAMGKMTGVIEEQTSAANKFGSTSGNTRNSSTVITQSSLQIFANWKQAQDQRETYERESESRRNEIVPQATRRAAWCGTPSQW